MLGCSLIVKRLLLNQAQNDRIRTSQPFTTLSVLHLLCNSLLSLATELPRGRRTSPIFVRRGQLHRVTFNTAHDFLIMALQNSLVPTVLGAIGTVCWCINLLPQIWSNYRQKRTDGLPVSMLILWAASSVLSGVYVIAQDFNISLVVQPQCFIVLCAITWAQCLIYS
jgi:uncharacterized protein with PQ loop repeat